MLLVQAIVEDTNYWTHTREKQASAAISMKKLMELN